MSQEPFAVALRALVVASAARGKEAERARREALGVLAAWTAEQPDPAAVAEGSARLVEGGGVSERDRELLAETLEAIGEWARDPGAANGERVDRAVERLRDGLGPLLAGQRPAERRAADQERIRVTVRASISRRLREASRARDEGPAGNA
ncbi:hypothetical protein OG909_32225 [Streptomyces sp. NBC_01754]|uniref:hypothetical protein n=1 Tax=Streptomyces sp. NBC_01754 TaxID=2975930 RepID=UPI002DD98625|nr:hypothetical protein [Streptomyces sp. NBC_01754]WSC90898.1 hypothetical protein OG909_00480 [Streptomyces sp. NBC_01754]WSC96608.1 hypothetical protein OG909_32225 [Streptomyces sp. NBC_01754]